MLCELCKRNNANPKMRMMMYDINGTMPAQLCQPCLKKLKNAVRDPKPHRVEIYTIEEGKK